jgi:hypothetical protein
MHKKKDGGIACQKLSWFGLAGPLAGPSGGRPGQSGGAAELLFCKGFRRVVESARRASEHPADRPPRRTYRQSVRPRGRRYQTYPRTSSRVASNGQISTHL